MYNLLCIGRVDFAFTNKLAYLLLLDLQQRDFDRLPCQNT